MVSWGSRQSFERLENFVWLLNRMPAGVPPALASSNEPNVPEDFLLIKRVLGAYRYATDEYQASDGGWDTVLFDVKRDVHAALSSGDVDAAAAVLRNPAKNTFFWGFDAIASSPAGEPEPHELVILRLNKCVHSHELYALWLCDGLLSLAEAVGARRADYPEIDIDTTLATRTATYNIDSILDDIEAAVGIKLNFPNPFPGELGLPSNRGIIGFRSIQSLYQAWRIAQLANGDSTFRVLEIGAGLGRTAYFAHLLGVTNYTIIDIPLTNAAQGYFLGRVLGPDRVALHYEEQGNRVRVLPATVLTNHNEKYDLIVNVDSLTEMPYDVASMYWLFARKSSNAFLSINHEYNPHTVHQLYKEDRSVRAIRYPYPLRRGYLEEFVTW